MARKKGHILGIVSVCWLSLVLLLPLVVGCAPKAEPPPSPEVAECPWEKFPFVFMNALSGPYAIATAPLGVGMSDWIGWYNEQGGIKGVPVEAIPVDHAGDIPKALDAYADFLARDPRPPILHCGISGPAETLHDRFVEDGIINVTGAMSNKTLYPPANTFATGMTDPDRVGAVMDWLVDVWAPKTGMPVKWAYCTWDSPYGRSPMCQEVLDYAAKRGVEIVAKEVFAINNFDVKTQLLKIKEAEANWVWCTGLSQVVAISANELGILTNDIWDTTPGKIRIGASGANAEGIIRIAAEEVEGQITCAGFTCWNDTDVPMVQLMRELHEKNNRKPEDAGSWYLFGGLATMLAMHVVEETVDEVGWDKLDAVTIKKQLLELKDAGPKGWSAMGAAHYAFTEDKLSVQWGKMLIIQDGKVTPMSDWVLAPDLKPYDWAGE